MIKKLISQLSGKEKAFFLILTIITGIIILWPLHNFQYSLAQGDHGRDLYCFKKAMEGSLPYRDFSWLFGPFMPYYYSLFYLFGGVTIQSVLLGQILLILLAGIFVYLICSVFLPPAFSFVCAFWYWSFRTLEFFYTYNHIGGLLTLLITFYCALKYIRTNKQSFVYAGFINIFLLLLIRLNMGVAALIAFVFCLFLTDFVHEDPEKSKKRRRYILFSLATLAVAALIYWALIHSLPAYAIQQSFPYSKTQRADYSPSLFHAVLSSWNMLVTYFTATLSQKIFGIILLFAAIQSSLLIFSKKSVPEFRKDTFLAFSSLFVFLILSSHEFFASGVFYRFYWVLPFIIILIFYLIATAIKNISSPIIKILVLLTLFLPSFFDVEHTIRYINFFKNPKHELKIGANHIYTSQSPHWFQTVTNAVDFIEKNTKPDDKILVLPLDPLYLFLSGRDSATRQLVFFEHINIGEEQERKIISELEKNADWALISSRSDSQEGGMGTFGKTYCPLLAQYLQEHFETVAVFGDWVNPPGWAWNHGVKILRRK